MSELLQKQFRFTEMTGKLIAWAYANGYTLTYGEALRTPEQAKLNAAKGSGVSNSLHLSKLAVDLNLFKNRKFLNRTEDHTPLGEYWESLGGTWGGRFNDGNHYSLEHNGVK